MAEEGRWDFLKWLGPDLSTTIFSYLNNPSDLVRASVVSRSWHNFVISNGFSKKLCLKTYPETSNFVRVIEVRSLQHAEVGTGSFSEWNYQEIEHRAYALIRELLASTRLTDKCILASISASSTDDYPRERINNTLNPDDEVNGVACYWSSDGQGDPEEPAYLTYRLSSKLCMVEEIRIRPFQAFFQFGFPIYSAQAVRFRLGYPLSPKSMGTQDAPDSEYEWTYISPTYQMMQVNHLQSFKLPKPVLCIGAVLQVELLGRVQKQESDGLYYLCVCHVQVAGRPVPSLFDVDILDNGRSLVLKYFPGVKNPTVSKLTGKRSRVRYTSDQIKYNVFQRSGSL